MMEPDLPSGGAETHQKQLPLNVTYHSPGETHREGNGLQEEIIFDYSEARRFTRASTWTVALTICALFASVLGALVVLFRYEQMLGLDESDEPTSKAYPNISCPVIYEDSKPVQDQGPIDINELLSSFRTAGFERWNMNFEEIKDSVTPWKRTRFSELKSGDTIYESGCGSGLNLVMTLEILKEARNVTSLVVYGSDHIRKSAAAANELMDAGILPAEGIKGTICAADPRHLSSFIPRNSFDLVYSGYIHPIENPLDLDHSTDQQLLEAYGRICNNLQEADATSLELMKNQQEEYYAKHVEEMIQIAKPGSPVIVEQVSLPICDNIVDRGGVDRTFWTRAVQTYDWDVDINSVETEMAATSNGRYNVFMRKNV